MLEQANLYELSDQAGETQVFYSTTSAAGPPQFIYVLNGVRTLFSGDQIEMRSTALGDEVTVTVNTVVDDHTTTLTLLIPVTLVAMGDKVPIETLGVLMTTVTTSAGSPAGASQRYVALHLVGMAKQVDFSLAHADPST
jgi:hypothetical protein